MGYATRSIRLYTSFTPEQFELIEKVASEKGAKSYADFFYNVILDVIDPERETVKHNAKHTRQMRTQWRKPG